MLPTDAPRRTDHPLFPALDGPISKTIDVDLKADTKKLFATDIALRAVTEDGIAPGFGPTAPPKLSLKSFCEQRRNYLLSYPGIKQ